MCVAAWRGVMSKSLHQEMQNQKVYWAHPTGTNTRSHTDRHTQQHFQHAGPKYSKDTTTQHT